MLQGRVAIVTGGARGIGAATCVALAREGAQIVVNYHRRADCAASVVREIETSGGKAIAIQADVSLGAEAERLIRETVERYGGIDILVNNAGEVDTHKPWQEISEAEWDRVLAVNLKGCFLCFRSAYPYLRASGHGRVVNISSTAFFTGQANLLHYVSSKGGMIGFTRTLAREVGHESITVNSISPGAIRTDSELVMFPDQERVTAQLLEVQSIKRRGLPSDIADAVVFLASDGASFISGQTLNVDGGRHMH